MSTRRVESSGSEVATRDHVDRVIPADRPARRVASGSASGHRGSDLARNHARCRTDQGFALVMTISTMGVVGLLFSTYIAAARYRGIEASATLERIKAEAFADAGINLAVIDLLATGSTGPHGTRPQTEQPRLRVCGLDGALLAISITNESGKVDLNTGDPALLRIVVQRTAKEADRAARVSAAIIAMREEAAAKPSPAALASGASTEAWTQPYPNAFRSVVELGSLPSVDAGLYADLAPVLTVRSKSPGVNPALAPTRLRDLLAVDPKNPHQTGLGSPFFVAEAPGSVYKVATEAVTHTGTRFMKEAIVEITRSPKLGYAVREWHCGVERLAPMAWLARSLPSC